MESAKEPGKYRIAVKVEVQVAGVLVFVCFCQYSQFRITIEEITVPVTVNAIVFKIDF